MACHTDNRHATGNDDNANDDDDKKDKIWPCLFQRHILPCRTTISCAASAALRAQVAGEQPHWCDSCTLSCQVLRFKQGTGNRNAGNFIGCVEYASSHTIGIPLSRLSQNKNKLCYRRDSTRCVKRSFSVTQLSSSVVVSIDAAYMTISTQ